MLWLRSFSSVNMIFMTAKKVGKNYPSTHIMSIYSVHISWMKLYFSNLTSYLWMGDFLWLKFPPDCFPLSDDSRSCLGLNTSFSDCVWLTTCKGKSNKIHTHVTHQLAVSSQAGNHTPTSVVSLGMAATCFHMPIWPSSRWCVFGAAHGRSLTYRGNICSLLLFH